MNRKVAAILTGGLIAGVMDISYAVLYSYFRSGVAPTRLLQSVASGLLGSEAYTGGHSNGVARARSALPHGTRDRGHLLVRCWSTSQPGRSSISLRVALRTHCLLGHESHRVAAVANPAEDDARTTHDRHEHHRAYVPGRSAHSARVATGIEMKSSSRRQRQVSRA